MSLNRLCTVAGVLSKNIKSPGALACLPRLQIPARPVSIVPALPSRPLPRHMSTIAHTGFYNRRTQEELWGSATGVSKAGAKKGRAKGAKKRIKDINRGQVIGRGPVNMVWPGLNAPVMRNNMSVSREKLPDDAQFNQKLIEAREKLQRHQVMKIHPLERGYSGTKLAGRTIGPPDPVGGHTFEGFESIVLEFKQVSTMKGTLGRSRRASVFTVTGNGQGVAGFSLRKSRQPNAAIRTSKNRAAQQLYYLDRYNDHTVMHDFVTQFGRTLIHVKKVPEGTGLICHRVLRSCCRVIGIKDIWCKIEGATNVQNMTKAFFLGLLRQKTFQQIADEKGLHVVERRMEEHYYPRVVASPAVVRDDSSISASEEMDFTSHVMGGKMMLHRPEVAERRRFYMRLPGWQTHLARIQKTRAWPLMEQQLLTEYGFVRSHLFDQYPECHSVYWRDPALRQTEDDD